ncbi:unnamed protein product [Cochlearia groenlandica]
MAHSTKPPGTTCYISATLCSGLSCMLIYTALTCAAGSSVKPSRDRLVYFTTCMIGHLVEVHLKNGSVYSGIYHAADIEKDFGDALNQNFSPLRDVRHRNTLILPFLNCLKLSGIILKMASLIKDGTLRGHKSRSEFFRKPPSKIFIIPADELVQVIAKDLSVSSKDMLKAVQSEKPGELLIDSSTRELEEKTQRIAREIERENTQDLHTAEERGLLNSDKQDTCDQTFCGLSTSDGQKPASSSDHEEFRGDSQPSQKSTNVDQSCSISDDHLGHLSSEHSISESQLGEQRNKNNPDASYNNRSAEESVSSHGAYNGATESLVKTSRDLLVYLTKSMIGHLVEVHLRNGSVYSGIFHDADVEKDHGIILKMAYLIKDGTPLRGHKSRSDCFRKPPSKTLVIPADELVQVVAKDLCISSEDTSKAVQSEKPGELLIDSSIPKSYHVDMERKLERWVPEENVPHVQNLGNVFDDPSKRGWDQFEANKLLFGVESTFDEELYTTKLEKSQLTRELREEAERIAREIEGEYTQDLHVAEERGLQHSDRFDIDEETKYSSVRRVDEEDGKLLDTCNDQNLGGSSTSDGQKPASFRDQGYEELRDDSQPSQDNTNVDQSCSISDDHTGHLPSEHRSKDLLAPGTSISESQLGERGNNNNADVSHNNRSTEESVSAHGDIKEGAKSVGGGTSETKIVAERERQVSQVSDVKPIDSSGKTTLNPHAKEFISQRPQPQQQAQGSQQHQQTRWSQEPHWSQEPYWSQQNQQPYWSQQNQQPYWPQQHQPPYAAYDSVYYPAGQHMPQEPAGYDYQVQQQGMMSYHPGQQQTYYPPRLPAQFQHQHPPRPPPPPPPPPPPAQFRYQHPPPPRAQHGNQEPPPPPPTWPPSSPEEDPI